jgi:hypothetical protein
VRLVLIGELNLMDLQILQWLVQMKVKLTSDSILIRLVALKEFHTSV